MILETHPNSTAVIETEFCIIGSGPAGITLSLELAKSGRKVFLLEAGGIDDKNMNLEILGVEEAGIPSYIQQSRLRYFGGTSGHWAGWCSPLDVEDFHHAKGMTTEWPIFQQDLIPYYDIAIKVLNLNDSFFTNGKSIHEQFFNQSGVTLKKWQFSTPVARFGEKFRDEVRKSRNISLLHSAPVIDFEMNSSGNSVKSVLVQGLNGKFTVKAQRYILACGGIENARLLMASSLKKENPIGDGFKNLGVGFMEHPHFYEAGKMVFHNSGQNWDGIMDTNTSYRPWQYYLQIHPEIRKKQNWLNVVVCLHDTEVTENKDAEVLSMFTKNFHRTGSSLKKLQLICEQEYNPASKIELKNEKDELGLNKAKVTWQLTRRDWKSYHETLKYLAHSLPSLGLGVLSISSDFLEEKLTPLPGAHHMGTTRMGYTSRDGYVDKDLNVFGVYNLSVLGSSVFSTGGAANPTLSIVALSLRLSAYLLKSRT